MTAELRRGERVRVRPDCVAFQLRGRTGHIEHIAERPGQREYRVRLRDGSLAWFYATDLERRTP